MFFWSYFQEEHIKKIGKDIDLRLLFTRIHRVDPNVIKVNKELLNSPSYLISLLPRCSEDEENKHQKSPYLWNVCTYQLLTELI